MKVKMPNMLYIEHVTFARHTQSSIICSVIGRNTAREPISIYVSWQ